MGTTQLPSLKELAIEEEGFFNTVWFKFFQNIYKAIRGNTDIKLGGLYDVNTTSAGNVSTSITDLISYSLVANTLNTTGDILEVEAWGTYAANSNNKTVTLEFGSQTLLTTGALAANDGSWHIKAKIIMATTNTQEIISQIISSNSSVNDSSIRTAGTQDLTTDLIIKCTATGGATNDITQFTLIINLNPNT